MATFVSLPREIRDQIYLIVIHEPVTAPRPSLETVQRTNWRRDPDDVSALKIRYPSPAPTRNPIEALLLTSRQVRDEARAAVAYYQRHGGATLTLDVVLQANRLLYPTWVNILPYGRAIPTLHVQLRNAATAAPVRGYADVDVFPVALRLVQLCNVFLRHGPALVNGWGRHKAAVLRRLVVESVVDPELDGPEMRASAARQTERLRRGLVEYVQRFFDVADSRWHVTAARVLMTRLRAASVVIEGKVVVEIDVLARAREGNIPVEEDPVDATTVM